jgi:hypothetical protein
MAVCGCHCTVYAVMEIVLDPQTDLYLFSII